MESIRAKTETLWRDLHKLNHAVIQPENLLAEVGKHGPVESDETWENAYVALKARFLASGCPDEPQFFVEYYLLYASQQWGWRELLPRVVAELQAYPEAVEEIASGLQQIGKYGPEYGATSHDLQQLQRMLINAEPSKWERFFRSEQFPIIAGNAN